MMNLRLERRLLQGAVGIACIVPLSAGLLGVIKGAAMIDGISAAPIDLDSHFRYLSGLLLGIGIAFAACVPTIERNRLLFPALSAIVILGGLARLASLLVHGAPGFGHRFGLFMEIGVVPLLLLWQQSLVRRSR